MLTTHPTFQSLGTTQEQRGLAYAKLLDQSMSEDQIKELRASLQQQRALAGKNSRPWLSREPTASPAFALRIVLANPQQNGCDP